MPSENNFCGGLLSGQEIKDYKLIEPMSTPDDHIPPASYDLTVGDRHFLYAESGSWQAVFLGSVDDLRTANAEIDSGSPVLLSQPLRGGDRLVIPAFGSAIVQLAETVDLYTVATDRSLLIAGRFDLKLKAIYKGLISQQATQVEPCYKGKLYCFLHNLGEQEVSLGIGEKLATIEFSYVGGGLEADHRQQIIEKTIAQNKEKYVNSPFVSETGIKDIRWLHQCGMLPEDSGIAPIYHLMHHNLNAEVEKYLETSDAVEKLANRVDSKMSEKQTAVKAVFTLIAAVVTFFAGGFLIDVMSELHYFKEELAFLLESTLTNQPSLQAIREHTVALAEQQSLILRCSMICILIIVVLLLILFWRYLGPQYEQKWERKRKAQEAKSEYKLYKKQNRKINGLKSAQAELQSAQAKLETATTVYEAGCVKLEKAKANFRQLRSSFRNEEEAPPDGNGTDESSR